MAHKLKRLVAVGLLAATLAACGSNETPAPPPPPPPPPPAPVEDQFGAGFGSAFRANPNSDASDPAAGDIIPVSLTAEPVTL